MKHFLFLLFLTVLQTSQNCWGVGNEGAHGGDTIALEFQVIGKILSQELQKMDPSKLSIYSLSSVAFEKSLNQVRVVTASSHECFLNGEEVDALNFTSELKIKINSDRWVQKNLDAKVRLVFHEYLGIMGVERDSYKVTNQFLEFLTHVSQLIRKQESVNSLNLFYGKCKYFPPVTSMNICEAVDSNEVFKTVETCATSQAMSNCRLSGKTDCIVFRTTFTPVIRTDLIGLRYCEILTIAK